MVSALHNAIDFYYLISIIVQLCFCFFYISFNYYLLQCFMRRGIIEVWIRKCQAC